MLETGWFGGRYTRREVLFAVEQVLSERHREIFLLRHLGNEGRGMTHEEVSLKVGTSRARVGQILRKCLQRLKHYVNTGKRPHSPLHQVVK